MFSIYYKYVTPDPGREVIYVQGKNDDKMIAHLGLPLRFLPITINKWLKPDDPRAMASNKYPITNSGIGNLIKSLLQQFELAKTNNELESFSFGTEYLDGRETIVIARRLPHKECYMNYLSIVNIDKATHLPIRVLCINWDLTLEEYYYYKDLKINQGLTDNDFDPKNSDYKFVGITLK